MISNFEIQLNEVVDFKNKMLQNGCIHVKICADTGENGPSSATALPNSLQDAAERAAQLAQLAHRLLLHHLVNRRSILGRHLVELIDAYNTPICENLQAAFHLVLENLSKL